MNVALLIARVVLGLSLAAHGSQKLFGWFGGHGIEGTGGFFEGLGFRPGRTFATLAGLCELVGGLLTALGLLGPIGPALMIVIFVVAMLSVHAGRGYFADQGGPELPVIYAMGALMIAYVGPGRYALDNLSPGLTRLWTTHLATILVGLAILIGVLAIVTTRARYEAHRHGLPHLGRP